MATIKELLAYGKAQLEQSGNEYAQYERKVLLEEVLGCQYIYMLTHGDEHVPDEQAVRYKELIGRRLEHYPLQYLIGTAHFMDYTFIVNENVLIPRSDTEVLVEHADEILKSLLAKNDNQKEKISVLDLCCGSGCIGISLKLYHEKIAIFLSDFSKKAIEVTKKNLQKYAIDASVFCGDLFAPLADRRFHMIVSNPPYIEHNIIGTLMPEVREYEPIKALDGGEDGLDFYRRIIKEASGYLNAGGYLMVEIGYNQGVSVVSLMEQAGFQEIQLKKDYAGLDRIVFGHL